MSKHLIDYDDEVDDDLSMELIINDMEKNNIDANILNNNPHYFYDLSDDDDDDDDDNILVNINNNNNNKKTTTVMDIEPDEAEQLNKIISMGDSHYNAIMIDEKAEAVDYFNKQYEKYMIDPNEKQIVQIDAVNKYFNISYKLNDDERISLSKLITWTNLIDVQIKEHSIRFRKNLRINDYHTTNLIDINSNLYQYPLKPLDANHLLKDNEYLLFTYIGFNQNTIKDFTLLALKFNSQQRRYECLDVHYSKIIESTVNLNGLPNSNTMEDFHKYYNKHNKEQSSDVNGMNNIYNIIRKYKNLTNNVYYYSNNSKSLVETLMMYSNIVPSINLLRSYFKFENIGSLSINKYNGNRNINITNDGNMPNNFYLKKCKYRCSLCNSQNFIANLIIFYNNNTPTVSTSKSIIHHSKTNYNVNRYKRHNNDDDDNRNKQRGSSTHKRVTYPIQQEYNRNETRNYKYRPSHKAYSSVNNRLGYNNKSEDRELTKYNNNRQRERLSQSPECLIRHNKNSYLKFKNYYKNKNSNYFYKTTSSSTRDEQKNFL